MATNANRGNWTFWQLNETDLTIPQPEGWTGAYGRGPAGEVWHSGGNHWNRTWMNAELGVEITSLINGGTSVMAIELVDMSRADEEEPAWVGAGDILATESVDMTSIDEPDGSPAYYEEVDRRQVAAADRLLAKFDPDYPTAQPRGWRYVKTLLLNRL